VNSIKTFQVISQSVGINQNKSNSMADVFCSRANDDEQHGVFALAVRMPTTTQDCQKNLNHNANLIAMPNCDDCLCHDI